MDDFNFGETVSKPRSFFKTLPPSMRAALIFGIPFIAVDFFNYYSAGSALVLSLPVLGLLYAGCGALSSKFAADDRVAGGDFAKYGALGGLSLWLTSTVFNTLVSLIIGAASLGVTLLLGVPYLCLCAPLQLVGGALMGAIGGFCYSLLRGTDVQPPTGY